MGGVGWGGGSKSQREFVCSNGEPYLFWGYTYMQRLPRDSMNNIWSGPLILLFLFNSWMTSHHLSLVKGRKTIKGQMRVQLN